MGEGVTTIGKQYGVDDEDLIFVYANSSDSGGAFGLDMVPVFPPFSDPIKIEYARFASRVIFRANLITEPAEIPFVPATGDGSSHGATWANLKRSVDQVTADFRHLSQYDVERHVDGLLNIALEGAQRDGGGWAVVVDGLMDASRDANMGLHWRQDSLYKGLGYIAQNFHERQEAAMSVAQ